MSGSIDQPLEEGPMNVSRRELVLGTALAVGASRLMLGVSSAAADAGEEAAVSQSVETLRRALLEADKPALERVPPLSSATATPTDGSRTRPNSSTG